MPFQFIPWDPSVVGKPTRSAIQLSSKTTVDELKIRGQTTCLRRPNTGSRIFSLPDSVIKTIFEHAVRPHIRVYIDHNAIRRVRSALLGVCNHWRLLVHETAILWKYISFKWTQPQLCRYSVCIFDYDEIQEQLKYSAGPTNDGLVELHIFMDAGLAAGFNISDIRSSIIAFEYLLRPHKHRVSRLDVVEASVALHVDRDEFPSFFPLFGAWTQLRTLIYQADARRKDDAGHVFAPSFSAPNLRYLHNSQTNLLSNGATLQNTTPTLLNLELLSVRGSILPFLEFAASLTCLRFFQVEGSLDSTTSLDIYNALTTLPARTFPILEVLSLRFESATTRLPAIVAPNLQHLEVSWDGDLPQYIFESIFGPLLFPKLRTFSLWCITRDEKREASLANFILKHSQTLRRLIVSPVLLEPSLMKLIFGKDARRMRVYPNLRELHVELYPRFLPGTSKLAINHYELLFDGLITLVGLYPNLVLCFTVCTDGPWRATIPMLTTAARMERRCKWTTCPWRDFFNLFFLRRPQDEGFQFEDTFTISILCESSF